MSRMPFPIGGIGITPMLGGGGEDAAKKFSSAECLEALMKAIEEDPLLVRQHIQIITSQQSDLLKDTLWPAIFSDESWTRTSTRRPTHDDAGERITSTDREVRTYENEVWEDNGKVLIGVVTTEYGSITDIKVEVRW